MTSFTGNILDIPGLVPVNIGSSSPYPVPFAPKIKPASGSFQNSAPASYPAPNTLPGQDPVSSLGNVSGAGGNGTDGTSPILGGQYGDALSLAFSGGLPDYMSYGSYAPQINPAQNISSFGGLGLGNFGSGLSDRFNSLTNTPNFNSDNYAQMGINAAGLFSPLAPIAAGALQGFNLLDPGTDTGNSLGDMAATPGLAQKGSAWLFNQLNQAFGGQPMSLPPDASGPSGGSYTGVPGIQTGVGGGYVPPESPPAATYQDNMNPGWGGAGGMDLSAGFDPFFQNGGQAYNIGGADIFNSIGLAPWQTPDYGGQTSFGGGGGGFNPWGGNFSSDNNGGWGQ